MTITHEKFGLLSEKEVKDIDANCDNHFFDKKEGR
jgi:hypothetical protein